jgi:hypothetical protein
LGVLGTAIRKDAVTRRRRRCINEGVPDMEHKGQLNDGHCEGREEAANQHKLGWSGTSFVLRRWVLGKSGRSQHRLLAHFADRLLKEPLERGGSDGQESHHEYGAHQRDHDPTRYIAALAPIALALARHGAPGEARGIRSESCHCGRPIAAHVILHDSPITGSERVVVTDKA